MKHRITLLFVLLFASCEQVETKQESIGDDPNVFVFSDASYYGKDMKEFNDMNLSVYAIHELTFTISDEDNCTYYIFNNTFNIEGNLIPLDKIFRSMPIIDMIKLKDKIGNIIFEFDPVENNVVLHNPDPLKNLEQRTYRGKIPKYYSKSSNLTRSKLERTKDYGTSVSFRMITESDSSKQ